MFGALYTPTQQMIELPQRYLVEVVSDVAGSNDLGARYWGSFAFLACAALLLQIYTRTKSSYTVAPTQRFTLFQRNYVFVFLLAMFSDWLQGPYVYEV